MIGFFFFFFPKIISLDYQMCVEYLYTHTHTQKKKKKKGGNYTQSMESTKPNVKRFFYHHKVSFIAH